MSSSLSLDEKIAALLERDDLPERLRLILEAARDCAQADPRNLADPLVFRAQVERMAGIFHRLYGKGALEQARKVAARFGNGAFARMVVVELSRIAGPADEEAAKKRRETG